MGHLATLFSRTVYLRLQFEEICSRSTSFTYGKAALNDRSCPEYLYKFKNSEFDIEYRERSESVKKTRIGRIIGRGFVPNNTIQ